MSTLDHDRILHAALSLADAEGIEPLTIRRLAGDLGVGAMSIYHYFPNKEAILDAMVDEVFSEVQLPAPGQPWREAMHQRSDSMRTALQRHRWAIGLMDSRRNPGPATLRHHEAVLSCLREAGFSLSATAHTFALLDAYVYGFTLQAVSLPFSSPDELQDVTDEIFTPEAMALLPRMTEFATQHALQPDYDFADEFAPGLQVVLDGIQRAWAP